MNEHDMDTVVAAAVCRSITGYMGTVGMTAAPNERHDSSDRQRALTLSGFMGPPIN